jgi:hypothetical protein
MATPKAAAQNTTGPISAATMSDKTLQRMAM